MLTALKNLMSGPDADRMSIDDLRLEVCKMTGVAFDTTVKSNMHVFSTSMSNDCCVKKSATPSSSHLWMMVMQYRHGARRKQCGLKTIWPGNFAMLGVQQMQS